MWESTRKMSEAIASGIRKADPTVTIKQFNLANSDKNDVLTQVFKSKAILIGSPTINNVMLPQVAALLEEIQGLRFTGKTAAAFGSHGWNGGAVNRITQRLKECGFNTLEGTKVEWRPTQEALQECEAYGKNLVAQLGGVSADDAKQTTVATELPSMVCRTCSWVYDPAEGEVNQGVEAGTAWENVAESFLCPVCFMGKDDFVPVADAAAKAA